jgi:hypothetical protein
MDDIEGTDLQRVHFRAAMDRCYVGKQKDRQVDPDGPDGDDLVVD